MSIISEDAYTAVIVDILDSAIGIFTRLDNLKSEKDIIKTKASLQATINSSDAIAQCLYDTEQFIRVHEKNEELKPFLKKDLAQKASFK